MFIYLYIDKQYPRAIYLSGILRMGKLVKCCASLKSNV